MATVVSMPSRPPGPPNAASDMLPYPYITQWDPQHQATFYANTETGDTSWSMPNVHDTGVDRSGGSHERGAADQVSRSGNYSRDPYSVTGPPIQSGKTGEAASFYGAPGAAPTVTEAVQSSPTTHGSGQSERGLFSSNKHGKNDLGAALGGSGIAAMAYKLYKEYRNGKHNQQQFKPPSGNPPSGSLFGKSSGGGLFSSGGGMSGPNVFPTGGAHHDSERPGYGQSNYGQHGRPETHHSSESGGFLSSLLDGGDHRPQGGRYDQNFAMFGGAGGMMGHGRGRYEHGQSGHGEYRPPGGHGGFGNGGGGFGGPRGGGGGGGGRGRW